MRDSNPRTPAFRPGACTTLPIQYTLLFRIMNTSDQLAYINLTYLPELGDWLSQSAVKLLDILPNRHSSKSLFPYSLHDQSFRSEY